MPGMRHCAFGKALIAAADFEVADPAAPPDVEGGLWDAVAEVELDAFSGDMT
jgi:hypothetical protein